MPDDDRLEVIQSMLKRAGSVRYIMQYADGRPRRVDAGDDMRWLIAEVLRLRSAGEDDGR